MLLPGFINNWKKGAVDSIVLEYLLITIQHISIMWVSRCVAQAEYMRIDAYSHKRTLTPKE